MKTTQNNGAPISRIARIAVPILVLVWVLFKYFYPFADFFNDSYTYIDAAVNHSIVSFRPIGYSVFLNAVHSLSASDTFLVSVQYLLIQAACGYLFFSLRRWARPSIRTEWILLAFLLLDPVVLYISNYVSSDALFTALSLVWVVELIWLINRPSWRRLAVQLILLSLIFFIRYSAIYYPLVAVVAFLLTPRNLVFKITGIAGSIGVLVAGTVFTKEITRRETGAPIFSAFSGWQMANNAMNIYPHIPTDTDNMPSPECREIAGFTRRFFDSTDPSVIKEIPPATVFYMWDKRSPLHQYMAAYRKKNKLTYFEAWNRVSPALSQYGYHLLRQHPLAFIRYYCWPNTKRSFLPPLVEFEYYNEGKKEVDPIAQKWFHYRTNRPEVRSATIQASLLRPFTWLYLISNGALLLVIFLFIRDKDLRTLNSTFSACLTLITAFFLVNSGFSIFATPNEFRYQVLPLILFFTFAVSGLSVWIAHRSGRN